MRYDCKRRQKGLLMRVLVYGSLNIDYVYEVDHILKPGETESSYNMQTVAGGKGLNQAIALAKAGVETYLAGQIGEEGDILEAICKDSGMNVKYLDRISGRSGHTFIQVDKNGQNSILLFGGANREQKREKIDAVIREFSAGDIILLQNEINELPYIIECAFRQRMYIVLNPSPFNDEIMDCDLHKVSLFILNEVEGFQLTGNKDPDKILTYTHEKFPTAEIILTLGEEGSWYLNSEEKVYQKCVPVSAIDTTAAGDTYTGYFIASRLEGMNITDSMRRAACASAIACTRKGAAPSIPSQNEVLY